MIELMAASVALPNFLMRKASAWLDPENADTEQLATMLGPFDPKALQAHPVSGAVNAPKNQGPKLIEEVAAE
jgi:putative SOS response-associated peptidase YedK